ncbi:hypothetical protein ANRL3_02646 [Anaerolineae bacterium]|nr:hypothetical protein ANRL3_02646 [Anaerolineae bacterium]
MYATYNAIYQDKHGEEKATIQLEKDGHGLTLVVRGVEFRGYSFRHIIPNPDTPNQSLELFSIDEDKRLHSFNVVFEIETLVIHRENEIPGKLRANCIVNSSEADYDYLQLALTFGDLSVQSSGGDDGFEDALREIAANLPVGTYIKSCINCRFADFEPFCNSGLMGELACFVKSKDKFIVNRGKSYPGWGKKEWVFVQEFYLCPEFQKRAER